MYPDRTYARLFFILALLILSGYQPAYSLREAEGEGNATSGGAEFEQIIQHRKQSEENAARELREISAPPSEVSVTVKVRGRSTEENPRGAVLAEARVSREEIEESDIAAVYRRVRSGGDNHRSSQMLESEGAGLPSRSLQDRSVEHQSSNWMIPGLVTLALGGWWVNRNFKLLDFRS